MEYIVKQNKTAISQKKMEGYLKLSNIVRYARENPLWAVSNLFGIELLDYQSYVFMKSWTTPFCVWCQSRSSGKALSLDTPIQTQNGVKYMKDIKVGDYVFGLKGEPVRVEFTSDIFYNHDCYEVTFEDGEKIISDAEHLWSVKVRWQDEYKVYTTEEMSTKFNQPYTRHGVMCDNYVYRVPMPEAVQYIEKDLPLDPYVLGVWLGDGNARDTRITCADSDLENMLENLSNSQYNIKVYDRPKNVSAIGIGVTPRGQENIVKTKLKQMNLIQNKHIPEIYLYGSVEQRMELLRGLMDTDGTIDKEGHCEFYQKKYEFVRQVSQLISSLGIKNRIREKRVKYKNKILLNHVVSFTTSKEKPCFKLKRKYERLKDVLDKKGEYKTIVDIKKVNRVPTKCISVDSQDALYLCGNNFTVTHNTTLGSPFIMAKSLLIPNFRAYILAGSGEQSKEMFQKIEKIAKREISSFTGLTDIFYNETVKNTANTDGFTHNPNSFEYKLYNGSMVNTLNSIPDNLRSKRSSLNFYDEAGFIDDALFVASEPFTTQNSNFSLGGGVDTTLQPKQFANQRIYASSASSVDTYFFQKYRDFAKKMFLGDNRYFVGDIKDEIVLNATYHGKLYPVPLLTQETIDIAMRENPEKAMREYKNIFSREGGETQAVKRASIIRNSKVRPPQLLNDGKRKFAIAYDPARNYDNSVCMIGEIFLDKDVGYKMNICNGVSFVDIAKKSKTPIRTPEQIDLVKQMILDYNGQNAADYENIETLLIDSGAGGGGLIIADSFMEDWKDTKGKTHRGLIDKIESGDYANRFPNAVDKIRLMTPKKYKNLMFDAMVEMIGLDLVGFTEEYDGKGFLNLFYNVENESSGKTEIEQKSKMYKLSFDEELALKNIDLAKEEIVNIHKVKLDGGGYKYGLSAEKKNKLNDDRAYCVSMLCWYLQQKRRDHIVNKKNDNVNWLDYCMF